MPYLLVTLFIFALLVTSAGFYLSFKTQSSEEKVIFAYRASRGISISSPGGRLRGRRAGKPVHWVVIVIGLASIFLVGVFAFNLLLPRDAVFNLTWFADGSQYQQAQASPATNEPPLYGASQHVVRISQLDPGQYDSVQDYNLWAYSACSAAAMTEVINAYGHNYRIADILKVEASLNEITPSLGLVDDSGVARTVAKFGFKASWGYSLSYDQVIATANRGEPVIVSWPPARYPGGHLVVVIGGNSQTVFFADSSLYNRHSLSRAQFMKWWAGYSAVVTPA
ncbi:MAG TPA: C39 family peptidase [Ktedonobacteraceae bacterium]|nr:C39 family peptidase [Ktedonobacteraceae bacterium]